jgi:Na+-transporting NADH:ubiquinone oxidoreductase subunit NqrD
MAKTPLRVDFLFFFGVGMISSLTIAGSRNSALAAAFKFGTAFLRGVLAGVGSLLVVITVELLRKLFWLPEEVKEEVKEGFEEEVS